MLVATSAFPRIVLKHGSLAALPTVIGPCARSSFFGARGRLRPWLVRAMASSSSSSAAAELRFKNPAILVCDLQERFKNVIHEFDLVFAQSLSIPVHSTTQTAAKLGPTVASLAPLLPSPPHDKTRFSMAITPIASALADPSHVALVGIEAHICITQTALDLRDAGHRVYVIADGVSSCNRAEVVVALDRLRAEPGIVVTSSESWMYECLGDASHPGFKSLIKVVKDSSSDTKAVLEALPPLSRI